MVSENPETQDNGQPECSKGKEVQKLNESERIIELEGIVLIQDQEIRSLNQQIYSLRQELTQMIERYNQEWWVVETLSKENERLIKKGNNLLNKYYNKVQDQEKLIKDYQQQVKDKQKQLNEYDNLGKDWFESINITFDHLQINNPLSPASEKLFQELTNEL